MKNEIAVIQSEAMSLAKKSIQKEYFESIELVRRMKEAIAKAIAEGKRFVDCTCVPGAGAMLRYYQSLQYVRSCEANQQALAELHLDAFDEPMPSEDPDLIKPVEQPVQ